MSLGAILINIMIYIIILAVNVIIKMTYVNKNVIQGIILCNKFAKNALKNANNVQVLQILNALNAKRINF